MPWAQVNTSVVKNCNSVILQRGVGKITLFTWKFKLMGGFLQVFLLHKKSLGLKIRRFFTANKR